jgi:hypothetical protein
MATQPYTQAPGFQQNTPQAPQLPPTIPPEIYRQVVTQVRNELASAMEQLAMQQASAQAEQLFAQWRQSDSFWLSLFQLHAIDRRALLDHIELPGRDVVIARMEGPETSMTAEPPPMPDPKTAPTVEASAKTDPPVSGDVGF